MLSPVLDDLGVGVAGGDLPEAVGDGGVGDPARQLGGLQVEAACVLISR